MRSAALLKVPEVISPFAFTVAPSLRGKNSYQAPTSAFSRSARTGIACDGDCNRRSGLAAKYSLTSAVEDCEKRLAGASFLSARALMAGARIFFAAGSSASFSSNIFNPIVQQSSASISAGILISLS